MSYIPEDPKRIQCVLDLETLSLQSNAAILSIGAVKCSLERGVFDTFYRNVSRPGQVAYGADIDVNTLLWWNEQPQDLKRLVSINQIPVEIGLSDFATWYGTDDTLPLWGNGADFDNVILRNACQRHNIQTPWSHRANRCLRTLRALYGDNPNIISAIEHHALSDARAEAQHLLDILKYIHGINTSGTD